MKELSEKEALSKATAFCSESEHCLSEVKDRLMRWGVMPDAMERILKYLVQERYVDEQRYCQFFVNDKFKYNKWGRVRIAQELWRKRIPESVYAEALHSIDENEYMQMLRLLLKAKKRTVSGTPYEQNGKLIRFALGRGFEMDAIRRCINTEDYEEMAD